MNDLAGAIVKDAAVAQRSARAISLGPATLSWDEPRPLRQRVERRPGHATEGLWECAAFSRIALRCAISNKNYHEPPVYVFNVTLAYARTPQDCDFRWREISFYRQFGQGMQEEPTALMPDNDAFYAVFSPVIGGMAIAHGPFKIDAEDEVFFIDRWTGLFAKAAHGNLRPPQQMPLAKRFYT